MATRRGRCPRPTGRGRRSHCHRARRLHRSRRCRRRWRRSHSCRSQRSPSRWSVARQRPERRRRASAPASRAGPPNGGDGAWRTCRGPPGRRVGLASGSRGLWSATVLGTRDQRLPSARGDDAPSDAACLSVFVRNRCVGRAHASR